MWLVGLRQPQTKSTELRPCYLSQWKYLCKWLVGPHRYKRQPQSHHHATYPGGSTCKSGLSVHDSHRLQPQSHHHVTYCGGSTCEIGLSVHDSHRLKTQSYLHATYPDGSICECGLSVYDSHRLQPQSHHHATYSGGSICVSGLLVQEDTDCSTELLILVEVSMKVAHFEEFYAPQTTPNIKITCICIYNSIMHNLEILDILGHLMQNQHC